MASNADGKKCRAAGGGILTGPSIRVRRWSRLQLKTLARGICNSAADRNSSGEQAGSDDESHHLAHGDGRRDGDRGRMGGAHQNGGRSVTNVPKTSSLYMYCPEMHAHSVFVSLRQPTAERHTRELTSTDPRFRPNL